MTLLVTYFYDRMRFLCIEDAEWPARDPTHVGVNERKCAASCISESFETWASSTSIVYCDGLY